MLNTIFTTVCFYNLYYSIKANSYFARARRPCPRPHIDDYGKFQTKLILILPAKSVASTVLMPVSVKCQLIGIVYLGIYNLRAALQREAAAPQSLS